MISVSWMSSALASQNCLVGSVDLLYRNSWNEVRTLAQRRAMDDRSPETIFLGKMHQDTAPPDSVEVFCYSQRLHS
ncbi:class I adenylate cyclase [Escherichia coli]